MQSEWHRCYWAGQYPPVPFPSLIAQHEVSNLFSDDCFYAGENFSLARGTNSPKEGGDGEKKRRVDQQIALSQQDKQHIWLTLCSVVQDPCRSVTAGEGESAEVMKVDAVPQ